MPTRALADHCLLRLPLDRSCYAAGPTRVLKAVPVLRPQRSKRPPQQPTKQSCWSSERHTPVLSSPCLSCIILVAEWGQHEHLVQCLVYSKKPLLLCPILMNGHAWCCYLGVSELTAVCCTWSKGMFPDLQRQIRDPGRISAPTWNASAYLRRRLALVL